MAHDAKKASIVLMGKSDSLKKKSFIISNGTHTVCIEPMACEEDYDSMEELALVEQMSNKIESGMQSDQAPATKPKARKPKAATNTAEASLDDKIDLRQKQIQENEFKMLHIDISIKKIETNVCKCMYALA